MDDTKRPGGRHLSHKAGTACDQRGNAQPCHARQLILTVDQISAGRVEVGLGAGYFKGEHEAIGIDFLGGNGRADRFREAVEILDRALRGGHVSYAGKHFALDDASIHPTPTQLPRPPLWIAAQGPASLRVAARYGDVLVTMGDGSVEQSLVAFRARISRFVTICEEEGRDPQSVRRCFFGGVGDERMFESDDSLTDFIGRFADAGMTDLAFALNNPAQERTASMVGNFTAATRDTLEHAAATIFPRYKREAAPAKA